MTRGLQSTRALQSELTLTLVLTQLSGVARRLIEASPAVIRVAVASIDLAVAARN